MPADFTMFDQYQGPSEIAGRRVGSRVDNGAVTPIYSQPSQSRSVAQSFFPNVGTGAGQIIKEPEQARPRSRSGSSTTTRTFTPPAGPAPTLATTPYAAPEFDERKVAAQAQRIQAPSIRKLRQSLQQATAQRFDNPNVRRMTVREALAGFGAGLESVTTGASSQARQVVGAEHARQVDAAKTQFSASQRASEMAYQRAWDLYLRSGTETSSTKAGATAPATAARTASTAATEKNVAQHFATRPTRF